MLFTSLACENFIEPHYNITEVTVIFQCSIQLCRQSSSTFEQKHAHPPTKNCSPSSAATGTQHSAVPHHWCNGVIAGFLPKDQTGDNVMT
jgi:hypothetical protein